MKRARWIVAVATAGLLVAGCGGTYHPGPDQAVSVGGSGSPTSDTAGAETGASQAALGSGVSSGGAGLVPGSPATIAGASNQVAGPTATSLPNQAVSANQGGVIHIGAVNPLSGPIGPIGRANYEGAQAIFSMVNAQGGVNGAKIDFRVEDDQFDPVQGKREIQDLISNGHVFAFSGILNPSTFEAARSDMDAAGTPVVNTDGSSDDDGDPLMFPVFQQCDRNFAGNTTYAVQSLHKTKLAYIYIDIAVSAACAQYSQAVAKKLGASVVYAGQVAPSAPDCAAQMINARSRGAETVMILTDNLGVVKCVQAANQQAWNVPISISANIVDDPTVVAGLGASANGLLSSSPYAGVNSPEFEALCGQAIHRYFPNSQLQYFSIAGCIGATILVQGLRAIGPTGTRAQLVQFLESRSFSTGGLAPDINWRPGHHQPYDLTATVQVVSGQWKRVGPLYTPPTP